MSELGPLHHFLSVSVSRLQSGLLLNQERYGLDIVDRTGMSACNPCKMLVNTSAKVAFITLLRLSSQSLPSESSGFDCGGLLAIVIIAFHIYCIYYLSFLVHL
ncbi:hypothetical protein V2J09_018110 [Rumex salicifolius]